MDNFVESNEFQRNLFGYFFLYPNGDNDTTATTEKRVVDNIQYNNSYPQRKLAFIHIGKSGGTTASKMIRRRCTLKKESSCAEYVAKNEINNIPHKETQISLQVQEYYHTRKPNVTKYESFIVTVRHPIDRMLSWYLHHHPKNKLIPNRTLNHFFHCFDQVDDLATVGLKENKGSCSRVAHRCIRGNYVRCHHMYLNYHFYTNELLQQESKNSKEIFVLRTEHFWEDWQSINSMLDGSNITRTKHHTHRERRKNKILVTNRTISKEGMSNACRVLCEEIQLYKKLIEKAVNLNKHDKMISFIELNKTCPTQTISMMCYIK